MSYPLAYVKPLASRAWARAICSGMCSVARHKTSGSRIAQPLLGVLCRDLQGVLPGLGSRYFHLVVTVVGVAHQVAHVRHVDDVGHLEALFLQGTSQQVGEQVGA